LVLRRYFGVLYGILVALIVAIGVWWVIFLTHEGNRHERYELQRMATEREHAAQLIQNVPEIWADPQKHLGATYPDLIFRETADGVQVDIAPESIARVQREAQRWRRMFTAEGVFFLVLLAAGTTILTVAYRSEREFKRARELFLTSATHELKTPLASLRLYTETLDRPELGGKEGAAIRQRMLQDIQRLESLLEQILAMGYEEAAGLGKREILDLAAETRTILAEMDSFFTGHSAQVATDLPGGHHVLGQRFVLSMMLRNLLVNAVVHSRPPARVSLALSRQGRWVRLAVRDQGPGIARRDRKRIFEGFVRLAEPGDQSRPPTGAGLGLYLVKRKAELMGGRVELESEVGHGSTFTLVLPAANGAVA
jgi:signal transduction histidine kinase